MMQRLQLLTIVALGLALGAKAQDTHFTQFYHAPQHLSPALTGVFNGEYRLIGNFRSQWFTVPVPYTTFKAAFDARLLPKRIEKSVLGAGFMLYHDQAGDSRLSTLNMSASIAYTQRITERFFIGAGLQLGYVQRRFNLKNLTFDDQFNGDVFDPNIQSGDLANLTQRTFGYFDMAVGLNFRYQRNRRVFFDAGASIYHPHRPFTTFMGTDARLNMAMGYSFNGSFKLHPKWDIMPHVMMRVQNPYLEMLFGAAARYHFNENPGRETSMYLGATYRWGDALAPTIGFSHQAWQLGISYDVNLSKFVPATANNGGIEISFIYIWRKVPDLPSVKICPIM